MKIALVCSHGGHLTEMLYIMDALGFKGHDIFFITYDSDRTRVLEYRKYLFKNFGEKKVELLKSIPNILNLMIKERPDIIISNGAEIAIPFFYLGKFLRAKTVFIECYTRIDEPTITGKLVYPVSNKFLVLWPEMLTKYGKKARYYGGLFTVSESKNIVQNEKENMIFVTVGMHFQGFDRLVKKMDEISSKTNMKVVMQIGNTQYKPKNAEYFDFKNYEEVKELMRRSKIVICPGAMSAIDSIVLGTPVIIVPRSKEQNEVINDHQTIFAKKLEGMDLAKVVDNLDDLENIVLSYNLSGTKKIVTNNDLIEKIKI